MNIQNAKQGHPPTPTLQRQNSQKRVDLEKQRLHDHQEILRRMSSRRSTFVELSRSDRVKSLPRNTTTTNNNNKPSSSSSLRKSFLKRNKILPSLRNLRDQSSKFLHDKEQLGAFLISPDSLWKGHWDAALSFLLIYTVIVNPVRACFEVDAVGFVSIFEASIDVVFALDILLTFNTVVIEREILVTKVRREIAQRYLAGWFWIDLITVVPFGPILRFLFFSQDEDASYQYLPKLLRILRLLRLVKLLRVVRIQKLLQGLEHKYGIHAGIARLVKLIFWIVVVNHVLSCFWYFIPNFDGAPDPESWIIRHDVSQTDVAEQYITSAYWVFSTLTTVGYGDITAYTVGEKQYSLIVMAIGVTWYAFIVSSMSSIMASFDMHNAAMRNQGRKLTAFMRDAKLPRSLRLRLSSQVNTATSNPSTYVADDLLNDMPSNLRVEVLEFIHRQLIDQIHFLEGKSPQFCVLVCQSLRPLYVHTNDHIIEEGSHAEEMFFLISGTARAVKNKVVVGTVDAGTYFGEVGCILSDVRHASVIASSLCELYTLLKQDLFRIMTDYPQYALELRQKALSLLEKDDRTWMKDRVQVVGSLTSTSPSSVDGSTSNAKSDRKAVQRRMSSMMSGEPPSTSRRKSSIFVPPPVATAAAAAGITKDIDHDATVRRLAQFEERMNEELNRVMASFTIALTSLSDQLDQQ